MSTSVPAMRTALKNQYSSKKPSPTGKRTNLKWIQKVDRMSDNQVTAIYLRLKYTLNGNL